MARLARQVRNAGLGGPAGVLAVGTSLANGLGYVLTVVGARRLGPAEFGAFSALLALIVVGNVAALAIQATTARAVATGRPAAPPVRAGLAVAMVLTAALAAVSPLLREGLHLPSVVAAIAAAVAIGGLAVAAPSLGIVQGRERFRLLAALLAIQAALRVGGGLVGIAIRPTATAGLIGIAAGFVLAAVVAWTVARPAAAGARSPALRATLSSGALLLGFVVLTNVDVMLARHVLPADASGLYAAGSIFAKVVFWLPQFVPMLAFPAMTDPARRRGAVTLGVLAVAASGGVLTLLAWLFSDTAVLLVAGDDYAELGPWVPGFAALGALYALAHVLVYAHLARGDRWTTAVLWTLLVGYVVVVETTAASLADVLVPGLVTAGAVVCWGLLREQAAFTRFVTPARHRHHHPDQR
ncbi:O-antigen/teichoic acid export membrane protein [Haloactinopolyspora alba]|uniref:O-antigen/teichoic acid export membrane protein n=1 Tax=Haloactinopolyspora alba TaxID=648780 RepID=A0A2P8E3Q1_9ACTN|nr:hypothetical protein [Haloactinopolyspora alba]PSL04076.1 O-antigen/teichoic acid export membrane protein [Haloactinopolyspora alba]